MTLPGLKTLRKMFGLDWRSLALMRIGLALVILCDLWISAQSLRAFYTDDGVLPRQVVRDNFGPSLSVHMLGGSAGFEAALFALEAIFALMMLVGYRTRLATIGCWFLLISRQARNPLVLFGADMIEHNVFFWAVLLPLNRRYSVDAALARVARPAEPSYLGVAGVCAIAQFILIYVITALKKTGPTWQVDHTAVYYALALEMYARPLGEWLNQFDRVTAGLTVLTLHLELYAPWLFICPVATGWTRLGAFVLFGVLQVGFATCMVMGLFWVVMIVFMLMFLPAEFWSGLAEPLGRRVAEWLRLSPARSEAGAAFPAQKPPPARAWIRRGARGLRLLRDGALLLILAGVVLADVNTVPGHSVWQPPGWDKFSAATGLDQNYNMFAPDPQRDDGWFVLRGWEKNGANVDVWTGASPASFAKPAAIADTYIDERWGSYLVDLTDPGYTAYLEGFAVYLNAQWNKTHPGGEQLQSLQIIFMHQVNGPHHAKTDPAVDTLWTETFGAPPGA